MERNALIVPDLQIPFEHPNALKFFARLKKFYRVDDELVFNVGDELDKQWAGLYKSDPDALYTPKTEIRESIDRLKAWYEVFPKMKLAESNHGTRDLRKAFEAGIPRQMLAKYSAIIESPPGWQWKKHWKADTKHPFVVEHGDDYGGQMPHVQAAIHNGCSTAIGHHHAIAGVEYIKTNGFSAWAAAGGSAIDFESYAFNYARSARRKPQIGGLVVLNEGLFAIWIPLT